MIEIIIYVSILFTIFFVTTTVVIIRRRQKANQNVGYLINEGGARVIAPCGVPHTVYPQAGAPVTHYMEGAPITHYTPEGVPVTVYPPPSYHQSSAHATYPGQISSQMTVHLTAVQTPSIYSVNPPMLQRSVSDGPGSSGDPRVLSNSDEKRALQQTHDGAVESVSQI